jgi:hypothetical protein
MEKDELLIRHLELCQEIFERMARDGSWPWRNPQPNDDLPE